MLKWGDCALAAPLHNASWVISNMSSLFMIANISTLKEYELCWYTTEKKYAA